MARAFNGSGTITAAAGSLAGTGLTAFSIVTVARTPSNFVTQFPTSIHTTSSTTVRLTSSGTIWCMVGGSVVFPLSTITYTGTAGWMLLALTKSAGSTPARIHKFEYGTGLWVRSDTDPIGNPSGTVSAIHIGHGAGAFQIDGDVAVSAVYNRQLSDAALDAMPFSLAAWTANGPAALYVLDQSNTAQAVRDRTGGGADQTAISGTSVASSSVPIFGYGHPVVAVRRGDVAPAPVTGTAALTLPTSTVTGSGTAAVFGSAALGLPTASSAAAGSVTAGANPSITGIPQAHSVTTHGTTVTYTGGGTTGPTTYDLLFINSDNVVTVPELGAPIATRVNSQGSYVFAAPGGTSTATINLGGGINSPTNVLWVRVTDTGGPDTTATATAGVDGVTGTTTPAVTSGTLATDDNMVLAFAALHSLAGTPPAALTWSDGYQHQLDSTTGASSSGVYAALGVKVPGGTAAESPQASWPGGFTPADRYMLVTALLPVTAGAVTGEGTVGLAAFTGSVSGTVSTAGAASVVLPAVAGAAAGVAAAAGTGSSALPATTVAAAGIVAAAGTATAGLPAVTSTATGTVAASGAAASTLPAVTAVAAGTAATTGTAALTLTPIAGAGSGSSTATGSATGMLSPFTAAAAGVGSAAGTGSTTLPTVAAAGAGTAAAGGTVSAVLPAVQAVVAGNVAGATAGGIAAILPAATASGAGTASVSGTGSPALPVVGTAGAGTATTAGAGNTTLPAIQAAAAGAANAITGTGSPTIPAVQAAASGTASAAGLAAITLPALVAAAHGTIPIQGTITAHLPAVAAAATGTSPIFGSLSAELPALAAGGSDTPVYMRRPGRFTPGARRSKLTPGGHR